MIVHRSSIISSVVECCLVLLRLWSSGFFYAAEPDYLLCPNRKPAYFFTRWREMRKPTLRRQLLQRDA